MENHINRKISRLFPISFVSSCKFTTLIQNSIVSSHTHKPKRSSSSPKIRSEPTKIVPEFRNPTFDDDSKHTTEPYPEKNRRNPELQKSKNPSSSCNNGGRRSEISRGSEERCVNVVAKRSRDPYRDFRESMVEMIVEKKIRGVEDLEKLLETFLGLNDAYHHQVILNAFSDISHSLFSSSLE